MGGEEIARAIIASSGNSFHSRVATWFRKHGWNTLISPYYMDQSQNKAREIDLVVEKAIPISGRFGDQRLGEVIVRLYVECKYITANSVFWFTKKDMSAAKNLVCRSGSFRADNTYTNEHHYLSTSPNVAKVFATEAKSSEQDPFYKALNQVLSAYVSMYARPPIDTNLREGRGRALQVRLNYPVVVCSGFNRLFRTDFFSDTEPSGIEENFQLEVTYAYIDKSGNEHSDFLLVDFVDLNLIDDFCKKIVRNAEVAAFFAS